MFTGANTIADSILYSTATGVGVGDIPNATAVFDVNGKSIWRGLLNVSRAGNATTATGYDSYPIFLQGSAYNSATHAAVLPAFQLQVEPTGNNTATPGATFNLLASSTGGTPAETGLSFNTNGTINFASAQTFPGTVTAVTAGTDLTGTESNGVVTLNLNTAATNALYAQTAASNTFAGTQSFTKVGIGTTTPRSLLEIQASASAALGPVATLTNTLGGAGAESALDFNTYKPATTGTYNPMVRIAAQDVDHDSDNLLFQFNVPGAQNNGLQTKMAITPTGQIGIGTTTPISTLEASAATSDGLGPVITLTNPTGSIGGQAAIDFNTDAISTSGTYNPEARILAFAGSWCERCPGYPLLDYSDDLIFQSNNFDHEAPNGGLQTNMVISYSGLVGINVSQSDLDAEAPFSAYQSLFGQLTVVGATGYGGVYATTGQNSQFPAGVFDGTGANYVSDSEPFGSGTVGADGIDAYALNGAYAGNFSGNVNITGTLNGDTPFVVRIDHPLDAANKYLNHAAVQSSELMNIYTGNVTTDELGLATVTLPDWFQAENTDFRYQLTVIGGRFAQAIVSKEIANNRFTISTNASNVKVSWQITAVRQDAYAKAYPLVVEQEKPANEKGFYIQPELFGQPAEKQTERGRHPKQMQKMKAPHEARNSATVSPIVQSNFLAESKTNLQPISTTKP